MFVSASEEKTLFSFSPPSGSFKAKGEGKAVLAIDAPSLALTPQDENVLDSRSLAAATLFIAALPITEGASIFFSPAAPTAFFLLAGIAIVIFFGLWFKSRRRRAKF